MKAWMILIEEYMPNAFIEEDRYRYQTLNPTIIYTDKQKCLDEYNRLMKNAQPGDDPIYWTHYVIHEVIIDEESRH